MHMFSEAFDFAVRRHQSQLKPGTGIPYIYHPLAVASLVLKYGGDEDQAKSALLHDTIADPEASPARLAELFGAETARLAHAFADPELPPAARADWRQAREAYLTKLRGLDHRALLVVACEELHELEELLHDLRGRGARAEPERAGQSMDVWQRYPVHGMVVFWYFRELLVVFNSQLRSEVQGALVREFAAAVRRLKEIVFEGSVY